MKKLQFALLLGAITGLVLYLVWFVYLWIISMPIYHFTKEPNSYTANIYQADDSLGHTMIPNTHGYYIWGHGDSVAINTDGNGFRVGKQTEEKGGLLFLGDSFTLCEELPTGQAYPYMVADALCLPAHNAAVSGYGYAQMILKARQYIHQIQPKVVVFQISPWLGERAATPYMPALFFKVPSPYYNQQGKIVPPYYTSEVFHLTQSNMLDHYRQSKPSFGDKFGFVWRFTRKVFEKEYWHSAKLALGTKNQSNTPINDALSTEELALQEIIHLSKGSKLILLVMGYDQDQIDTFQQLFEGQTPLNVTIVNADEVLWSQPGIYDKESYERAYCFWHGEPPVLVDYHFNAHANQLIMDTLLQALKPLGQCAD